MLPVDALQLYAVFKGLTSVVYAVLWLGFLRVLGSPAPDAAHRRCRDVAPTWRAVLYVLAWFGIVGSALYACGLVAHCLLHPTLDLVVLALACAVIVAVYAYQIQYLDALSRANEPVGQCEAVAPRRRELVGWFAVVVGVFGLLMVGFGVWGRTYFEAVVRRVRAQTKAHGPAKGKAARGRSKGRVRT